MSEKNKTTFSGLKGNGFGKGLEDADLDSGFLSGTIQSEEIIYSTEISEKEPQDTTKSEENKSENKQPGVQSFKQETETEMDSAYIDSGAIVSQELTNDMNNLSLEQNLQKKSANNHIYFQVNEDGDTLLHLAILWPHKQVVQTLIRLAPDPTYLNIQNDVYLTPLHLAVLTEQPEIVRDLIIGGAKPTVRDRRGNTALHLACLNGHKDCVKHLLIPLNASEMSSSLVTDKFPQDLELWNYDGETCIHLAANCTKSLDADIIKYLVGSGADINAREGKQGRTILHKAVEECNEQLVMFLLKEFPTLDIEIRTYSGYTAYQLAVANLPSNQKYKRIIQELVRHGAETTQMMLDDDDSESEDELMPQQQQQNTKLFSESNSYPVNPVA